MGIGPDLRLQEIFAEAFECDRMIPDQGIDLFEFGVSEARVGRRGGDGIGMRCRVERRHGCIVPIG